MLISITINIIITITININILMLFGLQTRQRFRVRGRREKRGGKATLHLPLVSQLFPDPPRRQNQAHFADQSPIRD